MGVPVIEFDGARLKERRVAAGFGRVKFAEELGIGKSRIWKWEVGDHKPSQPSLDKICAVLGCSSGDLCRPANSSQTNQAS
jgi:transcriptional regulator with XRE-family HTH domain